VSDLTLDGLERGGTAPDEKALKYFRALPGKDIAKEPKRKTIPGERHGISERTDRFSCFVFRSPPLISLFEVLIEPPTLQLLPAPSFFPLHEDPDKRRQGDGQNGADHQAGGKRT
jgi:hypothetical protein